MRTPSNRQAGLARIDVLLSVGVTALLVLLAGVPGATGPAARAAVEAERNIVRSVDLARTLAATTRSPHGVAFDALTERLAVIDVDGQVVNDPSTDQPALIDFSPIDVDVLQAEFGPGGDVLVFDGQGLPLSGGSVDLKVDQWIVPLLVDGASGLVSPMKF